MDKLLKLLNEYVGEEYLYAEIDLQEGIRDNFFHNKEGDHEIEESYVISKKFGFIQRLVENEKIDFKNNKLQVIKDIDVRGEIIYDYTLFDKVDGVIMLLSISDEPIQDLISLLK